jgi:hypothetical protein
MINIPSKMATGKRCGCHRGNTLGRAFLLVISATRNGVREHRTSKNRIAAIIRFSISAGAHGLRKPLLLQIPGG